MKKFRLTALIVLLCTALMVSACSSSADDGSVKPEKKQPKPQENTGSYTSAIFSRDVNYDSFVPGENVKLPVDGADILDSLQIGKSIYFLADDGIYSLDIVGGSGEKIIDLPYPADDTDKKPSMFLSSCGESIFVYSSQTGEISEYSCDGSLIGKSGSDKLCCESVKAFSVTDNYFVISWSKEGSNGKLNSENQIEVFDRQSAELVNSYKMREEITALISYKENKLLYTSANMFNIDTAYDLRSFDADTGKSQTIRTLSGIGEKCLVDLVYNPQTDTVLTFSDTFIDVFEKGKPYVAEFSLSDDDNIIHKRFSFEPGSTGFIGVCENIVLVISVGDSCIDYFDFLNPPRSIALAYNETTKGRLTKIILEFEAEHGIMVRTTDYRDNIDIIDLKLMAGDTDFDLFCPVAYSLYKYIKTDMYGDLSGYPSLITKLENSRAATAAAKHDGAYFGVPTSLEYMYPRDYYPEGDNFAFSILATMCQYCAENIDIENMTYSDPDGEEFYKVLKYIYDNPLGNLRDMPYGDKYIDGEFRCLSGNYIMLNPASQNKDDAALFMEYVLDAYSGNIPALSEYVNPYMELDDGEYFTDWNLMPMSIVNPLFSAKNAVMNTDGSKKEIKKLAKEAAAEVAMRIGE